MSNKKDTVLSGYENSLYRLLNMVPFYLFFALKKHTVSVHFTVPQCDFEWLVDTNASQGHTQGILVKPSHGSRLTRTILNTG